MKQNHSTAPMNKDKKGISVGTLIVCFLIACGIWLYAQAIDDDINVKTYNQLQVEISGASDFAEANGYEVHSLGVQTANITISGTNRELAKYDAQSIRLIADVSTANNSVASVKAYYCDENDNKTELKNYEVTPAVVTVNVAKQVKYTVNDITTDIDTDNYNYDIDPNFVTGTFTIIGPVQDITNIATAKFDLDYQSIKDTEGTHKIHVKSVSFYDADGVMIFNETNKNENVKYDISGIFVSVTVENKNATQDGNS